MTDPAANAQVPNGPQAGQGGWALLSVMVALLLLSMIATGLTSLAYNAARFSKTSLYRSQVTAIADAVVARAVLGLIDPRIGNRWRVDGKPIDFVFDDTQIKIQIWDEIGKIDINAAGPELLTNLICQAGGLPRDKAEALADKVMDWRESDNLRHIKGATSDDYVNAGARFLPRQGKFETIDELQFVMDMTPEVFRRIRPAITIYSKVSNFETSVAPKEALMALPTMTAVQADRLITSRDQSIASIVGPGMYARPGILDPNIPLGGRSFTIEATFTLRGVSHHTSTTVMITDDPKQWYLVEDWRVE